MEKKNGQQGEEEESQEPTPKNCMGKQKINKNKFDHNNTYGKCKWAKL